MGIDPEPLIWPSNLHKQNQGPHTADLPTDAGGGKAGPYASSISLETSASLTSLGTAVPDNLSSTSPSLLSSCCFDCEEGLGGDWSSTSKMDPTPQRLGFLGLDCADVVDWEGWGGGGEEGGGGVLSLAACWLGGAGCWGSGSSCSEWKNHTHCLFSSGTLKASFCTDSLCRFGASKHCDYQ